MKKSLLILISLVPLMLVGQPRVDKDIPLQIIKSSQIITNPVGWAFDEPETKKWCGYYGVILPEYRNNNKKPIGINVSKIPSAYLEEEENNSVLSMQIKKTVFDSTTYYLLYIQNYYVEWDYPYIHSGRHNYKQTIIYVLDSDNYNKLWHLDTSSTIIDIRSSGKYSASYLVGCTTERTALVQMNNAKYFSEPKHRTYICTLHIKKEKNTIRFIPPQAYTDFSEGYFEVSSAVFNRLKI